MRVQPSDIAAAVAVVPVATAQVQTANALQAMVSSLRPDRLAQAQVGRVSEPASTPNPPTMTPAPRQVQQTIGVAVAGIGGQEEGVAVATDTPEPTETATVAPSATPAIRATATPTATASPTASPNPYSGDSLTNLGRVADAAWVDWPAWVPGEVVRAVPGVEGTGVFIWPVYGDISTPYSNSHLAIDIAGPTGSPVVASDTGTVVFSGIDYGGLGYAVEIDHGNGYISAYGHNSYLAVHVGQVVVRGQLIAYRGSTGHSTGPHVHFAIHYRGTPVNPLYYLRSNPGPAPVPVAIVPNLAGLTLAQAKYLLQAYPFAFTVDPPVPSTAVPTGAVVRVDPAVGTLAPVGTALHIALSSGSDPETPGATVTPDAKSTPTATKGTPGPAVTPNPATSSPTPSSTATPTPAPKRA